LTQTYAPTDARRARSTSSSVDDVPPKELGLKPGELVRVRPASQIFSTLDADGALDGMPFMPEMRQHCGRSFRVGQRSDKTCAGDGVVRRMHNTVHLAGVRCDGAAHGGCQAACLMFWKEAWLERVASDNSADQTPPDGDDEEFVARTLMPATRAEEGRYRCQATEIPRASTTLRFRETDQYVNDVRNWSLRKIVRGLVIEALNLWQSFSRRHLPKALVYAEGRPYPFIRGPLERGTTPSRKLDLQPGELVRVRSKAEIEATLDHTNYNRGLSFDGEMVQYCGRLARVQARVSRLIEESNGEMIEIGSDCIILEGVICGGDYHRFCPRGIYPYWREIWLERAEGPPRDGDCPISDPALAAVAAVGSNGRSPSP
jgi:hypothetical protein